MVDNQTVPSIEKISSLSIPGIKLGINTINIINTNYSKLFKNFIDMLKINIAKVEVCDLKDNTFFAQIYFSFDNQSYNMDARPSDAIALALRAGCPIFVDDKVLQKSKQLDGEPEAFDKSEQGLKWKEYLEKLSPEDFGKYKM